MRPASRGLQRRPVSYPRLWDFPLTTLKEGGTFRDNFKKRNVVVFYRALVALSIIMKVPRLYTTI